MPAPEHREWLLSIIGRSQVGAVSAANRQIRRLAMDLNYVFLRQQVERTRANASANAAAREAHEEMARQYELEIERQSGGRIVFSEYQPPVVDPGTN